ncbi:MAG TPA: DUF2378 family protein [Myxococcales bacterium]|nr:DUF2378 family protein [Myxococcales bacterium]
MNGVSTTTEAVATTDGSLFEAIARAFEPKGAFESDLRAAGFDVKDIQLRYPSAVLEPVLDVCARHVLPSLSREEAHREVGRRIIEKFFTTIFGKVMRTLISALGVERFLLRLPRIARMGTTGLQVKAEKVGPVELRLSFHSERLAADFIAGTIEGVAQVIHADLKAEIVDRNPWSFELRVSGLR